MSEKTNKLAAWVTGLLLLAFGAGLIWLQLQAQVVVQDVLAISAHGSPGLFKLVLAAEAFTLVAIAGFLMVKIRELPRRTPA